MRKFLASLAVVCFAGTAIGQSGTNEIGYDDADAESMWHISTPAGNSDWFNVDFNQDAMGDALALIVNIGENGGYAGNWGGGLYPENTLFVAPDLTTAIVTTTWPVAAGASPDDAIVSYIPATTLGPADDIHFAVQVPPGDSHMWLGADTNLPISARSYFTANGYATGANPYAINWIMRIGLAPNAPAQGTLLINGQTGTLGNPVTLLQNGTQNFCLAFYGCPGFATQFLLYLSFPPLVKVPLPFALTNTGFPFFPGPTQNGAPLDSWMICNPVSCNLPTTFTLPFQAIYQDFCDTKPTGAPKLKLSKKAFAHFIADPNCQGQPAGCWGKKDDGIVDWNIWKVVNPAGASDWFNVNMGTVTTQVNMITSMEVSNYDFCGIGPTWGEVGIYPDDGAGNPDLANAAWSSATASMNPGASDGTAPYTTYTFTGFAPTSGTIYHGATHWPTGDTCIWLGSDTDGTDSTCAVSIPNSGEDSSWTSNAYGGRNPFTGANWAIRINWTP